MKTDCMELVLLISSLVTMALAKPKPNPDASTGMSIAEGPSRYADESHLGDMKILGQPGQTLLNAAMAAMAPLIGRVVRMAPYVGTASNSITGTINNEIVSGFAIPITDEFLDYHERKSQIQNRAVRNQKARKHKDGSSGGISRNLV